MAFASKETYSAYTNKYQKETYDRITILRKKGQKAKIKEIADSKNMSMAEFINQCIDEKLKRMKIDL